MNEKVNFISSSESGPEILPGFSDLPAPRATLRSKSAPSNAFYLTDFSGLLSIFSSGLIRPAAADSRLQSGWNRYCPSRLLLWHGALPSNLMSHSGTGGATQPILIEIDSSMLKGNSIPLLNHELKGGKGSISRIKSDVLCLFPAGAIPLSSIGKIYLQSSVAIEEVKVRLELMSNFEIQNVKFESFDALVTRNTVDLNDLEKSMQAVIPCENLGDPSFYQRVDSLGGALLLSSMHLPSRRCWVDAMFSIFNDISGKKASKRKLDNSIEGSLANLVPFIFEDDDLKSDLPSGLEVSLLRAAIRLLRDTSPKGGLNLEGFIAQIASYSESCGLSEKDTVGLVKWKDYSIGLLHSQAKSPSLSDGADSAFRRAITLFIMRPKLDRLLQAKSSSLRPGDEVFFLSILLAGIYEGYARLSSRIKKASRTDDVTIHALALLCNKQGAEKFVSFPPEYVLAQKDESQHDNITRLISILINGHIVASASMGPDDAMRGLYGRAKSQDYNLEYDFDSDRFHYLFQYEEGRSQQVFISITDPELHHNKHMIRFSSPCRDLRGKGKLTAKDMEAVLLSNASSRMHCRFAIDTEKNQLIVAVDQLLATNDWEEFEYFCGEVARIADEYEGKLGLDTY
jgi:hypothetical protein